MTTWGFLGWAKKKGQKYSGKRWQSNKCHCKICFVQRKNSCCWRGDYTEALLTLHGLQEKFAFVLFLFLFQHIILPAYTKQPSMLLSYLGTIFLCFSEAVKIKRNNVLTKTSRFCHMACWRLLSWGEWNSFSLLNLKRLVKFRRAKNYQLPPKLSKLNMIIFVKDSLTKGKNVEV